MSFNRTIGIRVVEEGADGVVLECPLRPELMNLAGVLHGGVTATIADVAAGTAIWNSLDGGRRMTTVEMKINYLRPVREGKVVAKARVVKTGRTISVASVDLFDAEGRQVAVALATYMLLEGERPAEAPNPGR